MKPETVSNQPHQRLSASTLARKCFTSSGSASTEPGFLRPFREADAVHRWHGSLPERAFCQQDTAGVGTRATNCLDDLRQALRERAEERLQRCRGDCRSSIAAEPAVRPGEEPGSSQPANKGSFRASSPLSHFWRRQPRPGQNGKVPKSPSRVFV